MQKSLLIVIFSLSVLLASWLYYSAGKDNALNSAVQLRQLRVQLQHAEQRLHRLEADDRHALRGVLGEDSTAVQIRLAEFLGHQGTRPKASIVSYEQSMLPVSIADAGLHGEAGVLPELIEALRLEIEAVVAHAPALLDLIRQISSAVSGWPMDVRACDVQKTPMQNLRARCVIDVYHWTIENGT